MTEHVWVWHPPSDQPTVDCFFELVEVDQFEETMELEVPVPVGNSYALECPVCNAVPDEGNLKWYGVFAVPAGDDVPPVVPDKFKN